MTSLRVDFETATNLINVVAVLCNPTPGVNFQATDGHYGGRFAGSTQSRGRQTFYPPG
jgi:hypothetical protein